MLKLPLYTTDAALLKTPFPFLLVKQLISTLKKRVLSSFSDIELKKRTLPLKRVKKNPFSKKGGIYILYCSKLNKFYIGHGINFSSRKADHHRNFKNFQIQKSSFFKLNEKKREDLSKNNLKLHDFSFFPLLVVEGYTKPLRFYVATIELFLIKYFLIKYPENIWNDQIQDLLTEGNLIRKKTVTGKFLGGQKAKKLTDGIIIYESIASAARVLKVSPKTIRNWLKKKQHWKLL